MQNGIFERLWIFAFTLDRLGKYFADFNFRGSQPTAKFRKNMTRKFSILWKWAIYFVEVFDRFTLSE